MKSTQNSATTRFNQPSSPYIFKLMEDACFQCFVFYVVGGEKSATTKSTAKTSARYIVD